MVDKLKRSFAVTLFRTSSYGLCELVMREILAVLLFMLSSFTGPASAADANLAPAPCLGNWTTEVRNAYQVNKGGGQQAVKDFHFPILFVTAQTSNDGTVTCTGLVTGYDGAAIATMFYYPWLDSTDTNVYIPGLFAGSTDIMHLHFRFDSSPERKFLSGIAWGGREKKFLIDGVLYETLYHGSVELSRGGGAP